jgi:hypothetical protein
MKAIENEEKTKNVKLNDNEILQTIEALKPAIAEMKANKGEIAEKVFTEFFQQISNE